MQKIEDFFRKQMNDKQRDHMAAFTGPEVMKSQIISLHFNFKRSKSQRLLVYYSALKCTIQRNVPCFAVVLGSIKPFSTFMLIISRPAVIERPNIEALCIPLSNSIHPKQSERGLKLIRNKTNILCSHLNAFEGSLCNPSRCQLAFLSLFSFS